MQRLFDIILSSLALVFLSPLMLIVCIILKFTGEGELIYKQERRGKGGEIFYLLKFATMLKNSPNIETGTLTIKNDPRILPFGKFLRRSKINELPQLVNVLTGSMSLIGPRPMTAEMFEHYSDEVQIIIGKVRPGLSGVGSIIFRSEEDLLLNNKDPMKFYKENIAKYKGEVEKWYVENNGILIYWKLIIVTIIVIIEPRSEFIWRTLPQLPKTARTLFNKE